MLETVLQSVIPASVWSVIGIWFVKREVEKRLKDIEKQKKDLEALLKVNRVQCARMFRQQLMYYKEKTHNKCSFDEMEELRTLYEFIEEHGNGYTRFKKEMDALQVVDHTFGGNE